MSRMEAAFSVLLRADAKTTHFNLKFFDKSVGEVSHRFNLIPLLNQINKSKIRSKIKKLKHLMFSTTCRHCLHCVLERGKSWPFLSSHKQHCVTFKLLEESKKQATFNFGFGEGKLKGPRLFFPNKDHLMSISQKLCH